MGHASRTLLIGAVVLGTATIGIPAAAATNPLSSPLPSTPATTTVPLITGATIGVHGTGFTAQAAAGNADVYKSYQDPDGDRFVIPAEAFPYLDRGLDRSLFDVSALARDGITAGHPIPVRLSFAAGVTPTAPAGVTITSAQAGSAQGYLTAASGAAFAAALRQRIGADIAAGRHAGTSGLPDGLTSVSLDAAGAPAAPVQPHYPLHILRMNVVDTTGAPADGDLIELMNTDSLRKEFAITVAGKGIAKIAVPAGNYSATCMFADFDSKGNVTAIRTVLVNDFTVADSPDVSTVTLDERTATSRISASTPKPATVQTMLIEYYRFDATGAVSPSIDLDLAPSTPVYVNPTSTPKVGKLHYVVQWDGAPAAKSASDNYRYDVAFASDTGVPANEAYVVRSDQVATVHERFSADPATKPGTPGGYLTGAVDPTTEPFGWSAVGGPAAMPGDVTDYLGTADSGAWVALTQTPSRIAFQADITTYRAGHRYTVDWAHGPLGAGLGQYHGPDHLCDACVGDSELGLGLNPFRDSVPDHSVLFGPPMKTHFTLYQNGTPVFDKDGYVGATVTGVPDSPTTYRGVLDVDASAVPGISQSTKSHTDLTVKYVPGRNQGNTLPSGDYCAEPDPKQPCQVLPALTLNYQLASDETNTSASPVQVLGLQVGHLSYDGIGSHAAITSVTVAVSFDGGSTWQPAEVAGFAGQYIAVWQNPASARGTDPALKVTATDAAGGSISQTVTNAYTIAR